uniref:cGMP-dependent protein kinase, isozyme 2 forms cD4/T1/T3A/T3B n=1 Tax=Lygus hesperus TaxID=30085 RepID=A0A146KTS3_LYGHE
MRVCFESLCFSSIPEEADSPPPNSVKPVITKDMSGGSAVGRTPADLESRILELEAELRAKEGEILELRSQLDQFQSVFPFLLGTNNCNNNHIYKARKGGDERRKRAQGISAEPFDFQTIQELASNKFPVYNKSERMVRNYARKTTKGAYSRSDLLAAVEKVKARQMSITEASTAYHIHKNTLRDHVSGRWGAKSSTF